MTNSVYLAMLYTIGWEEVSYHIVGIFGSKLKAEVETRILLDRKIEDIFGGIYKDWFVTEIKYDQVINEDLFKILIRETEDEKRS